MVDEGPSGTPYAADPHTWIDLGSTHTITYDGGWLQTTGDMGLIVQ
jgi:hypothetical protein